MGPETPPLLMCTNAHENITSYQLRNNNVQTSQNKLVENTYCRQYFDAYSFRSQVGNYLFIYSFHVLRLPNTQN